MTVGRLRESSSRATTMKECVVESEDRIGVTPVGGWVAGWRVGEVVSPCSEKAHVKSIGGEGQARRANGVYESGWP